MRRTLRAALEESIETVGRVDAQVIVAHLLGVNRAYLATHPMRVLTEIEDAKIDTFVAQRALGAPVAYLVQQREFHGRGFALSAEVLIPRPETETLVDACLARLAPQAAFLDLGTGSGVVAVTVACERPDAALTATDVSVHALDVARANAIAWRCEERIELVEGSWYAPLAGRRYDMIASNPPYVAARDPHLAQGDLRFEPAGALTDGSADGLDSIRAIVRGAPAHLRPGGWLLFEHGYDQSAAARAHLEAAGFRDIVSIEDLAGIARVAGGKIG